jgi:hypothetical protein
MENMNCSCDYCGEMSAMGIFSAGRPQKEMKAMCLAKIPN